MKSFYCWAPLFKYDKNKFWNYVQKLKWDFELSNKSINTLFCKYKNKLNLIEMTEPIEIHNMTLSPGLVHRTSHMMTYQIKHDEFFVCSSYLCLTALIFTSISYDWNGDQSSFTGCWTIINCVRSSSWKISCSSNTCKSQSC